MRLNKTTTLPTALSLLTATNTHAENDRFIIKVDDSKKGVVKVLAKKLGGKIKVDADDIIATKFDGKTLDQGGTYVADTMNEAQYKINEVSVTF